MAAETFYNDVLEFQDGSWRNVGSISMNRILHAVSVINYLEIQDYCN